MKSVASNLGICAPLDVYRMLEEGGIGYVMTLMAIGGVCGQEKAVELILSEGASKCWKNDYLYTTIMLTI